MRSTILIIVGIAFSNTAQAQCNSNETMFECVDRLDPLSEGITIDTLTQEEYQRTKRSLQLSTTGDAAVNVLGSEVSLNDFLPLFNFNLNPGTGNGEEEPSFSIEYSPTQEGTLSGDFKLGLVATEPEISGSLREAIGDEDAENSLSDSLNLEDDLTLSLSYSYIGKVGQTFFGRSLNTYQSVLSMVANTAPYSVDDDLDDFQVDVLAWLRGIGFNALRSTFSAIESELTERATQELSSDDRTREFADLVSGAKVNNGRLNEIIGACELAPAISSKALESNANDLGKLYAKCIVSGLKAGVAESANAQQDALARFEDSLIRSGFYKVSHLIDNQPQLVVTASHQRRPEIAGGDESSFEITYETSLGGRNINSLSRSIGLECMGRLSERDFQNKAFDSCARSLNDYLNKEQSSSGSWRIAAKLSFSRTQDFSLALPQLSGPFNQEGARKLNLGVTLGREFQLLPGFSSAKVDIGVSYEDVSSDPSRQDRAMGNITLTQGIAQGAQLNLGFVWANRPEFLGDVDQEVTARIGLNLKLANAGGS